MTPSPSFLCLGTATYGADPDEATSFALLDTYVELGGNVIDTARCYSDWIPGEKSRSEKLIGCWLKKSGKRGELIIATKGGHPEMDDFTKVRMSRAWRGHRCQPPRAGRGCHRFVLASPG